MYRKPGGRSYRTSDPFRADVDAAIADTTARLVALRRIRDGDGLALDEDGMIAALWLATEPSDYDYCSACGTLFQGAARRQIKKRRVRPAKDAAGAFHGGTAEIEGRNDNYEGVSTPVTRTCPCGRDDAWIQHFAAYGLNLVSPFIRAGCPERCCARCGAGWVRIVEARGGSIRRSWHDHREDATRGMRCDLPGSGGSIGRAGSEPYERHTLGFRPSCLCVCAETRPGVVLDPFLGTGTTAIAALRLGRRGIGLELSEAYCSLARARIAADDPHEAQQPSPAVAQGALWSAE